ncbi:unnamed protein product [Taenia asiatica]|uniref:Uncharacterized protein n=1 Tax=Taenia asiatica TaxID=60517 RepID=A0A0R3VVJ0_TAEAS|nr:unnamed protein product [Taenia asiatica]
MNEYHFSDVEQFTVLEEKKGELQTGRLCTQLAYFSCHQFYAEIEGGAVSTSLRPVLQCSVESSAGCLEKPSLTVLFFFFISFLVSALLVCTWDNVEKADGRESTFICPLFE